MSANELPIPAAWRQQWAAELATPNAAGAHCGAQSRWMVFRLGSERCALPAASILRSHAPTPSHSLPGRRGTLVPRLMQIEGRLVLMADLVHCLGSARSGDAGFARTLEMQAAPAAYALPVDDVLGIADVPDAAIEPAPEHLQGPLRELLHGLWRDGADAVLLIDARRLAERLDADLG
ncbi:MAG: chemotaxis protein CheW [Rubrivivax sp.]|nr:chemotaxis protein CheW [Rubrivivax sp.]